MDKIQQSNEARIAIQPGFAWDEQDAYLFDIDGTLLRTRDRVHVESFVSSARKVAGFEVTLAGVVLHGSTDPAILREACRQAGISPEELEPHLAAIQDGMCHRVAERRHEMDLMLMPGVRETLSHLTQRGALLGVATGNLETIGWIKIEGAGLREWFHFGGFSDQFADRSELVGDAVRKARELIGTSARICVVGDTPFDISAARANGLPAIAVSTGHSSFDALLECQPEVCATSLADLLAATRNAA